MLSVIREAKAVPCADCGGEWPYYVMHFDHVRGKKKFNISNARRNLMSIETLREEMAKCDVVCANCHALRHAGQYKFPLRAVAARPGSSALR